MQKHSFWNSPKSLSRNEINKDRRLSLNCSKSRTCTIFTIPVLFPKKKRKFYVVRFFFPWVYINHIEIHFYPDWNPIGKPLSDKDTFPSMAHRVNVNYTIPIGRYHYPDWNPIGKLLGDHDTLCTAWLTGSMLTILSQLGDIIILIRTQFFQWGCQQAPIGKLLGDHDTLCTAWLTVSMLTILSQLGDIIILIRTQFSQWGCQQAPIGKLLGDHDTLCTAMSHRVNVNYTIPIGWYYYPD